MTSSIWVSRPMAGDRRQESFSKPLRRGIVTAWPAACKIGVTRSQVEAACQAPCTRTNVDIPVNLEMQAQTTDTYVVYGRLPSEVKGNSVTGPFAEAACHWRSLTRVAASSCWRVSF